ncbi:MAG: hypothetical protein M1436_04080 [Acidobacteria bacterium]|nr:hypothetical protein [Acidobacteriota bacterium]
MAGFQAGMLAALALLAWLGFSSAWYRRGFWGAANIMATSFCGSEALGTRFSWRTLAGVSLYLILYSLYGALFAVMVGQGWSRRRLFLAGILSGSAWYFLWFGLLWPRLNPLVSLYTQDRPMLWGHFLYGAMLARFPLYRARLEGSAEREPAAPSQPEPALYAAEQQQDHQNQQNQAE